MSRPMSRRHFTRGASAWLLVAAVAWAADAADDRKELEGTWRPIMAAVGDKPLPTDTLAHIQLMIGGDGYTATVGESVERGKLRIDPRQSPKAIDLISEETSDPRKPVLAIYELEGDRLTICYSLEEGVRPTELKTGGSMQRVLVSYERKRLVAGPTTTVR